MENQNTVPIPEPVIPPIDQAKKSLLIPVLGGLVVVLAIVLGVVIFLKQPAKVDNTVKKPEITKAAAKPTEKPVKEWLAYTNAKYNYSINYPADWEVREYPDTKNGAGFRPIGLGDDREPISISVSNKTGNYVDLPIEEYAKKGASVEIQNYNKLASIKTVMTMEGKIGYVTTWMVQPIVGQPTEKDWKESTPITYFEIPNNKMVVMRVNLDDKKYAGLYEQMLKSLVLTTQEVTPTAELQADTDAVIVSVMRQTLANKLGGEESQYSVSVSEVDGNSAKGMVSVEGEGGGGIWLAYKENDVWKLVWDGNGIIECSSFSLYPDYSKKIMPQCFDANTQEVVDR